MSEGFGLSPIDIDLMSPSNADMDDSGPGFGKIRFPGSSGPRMAAFAVPPTTDHLDDSSGQGFQDGSYHGSYIIKN